MKTTLKRLSLAVAGLVAGAGALMMPAQAHADSLQISFSSGDAHHAPRHHAVPAVALVQPVYYMPVRHVAYNDHDRHERRWNRGHGRGHGYGRERHYEREYGYDHHRQPVVAYGYWR